MTDELDQLRHERGLLAEAIVKLGCTAGIIDGQTSLTGPELLLVADDASDYIEYLRNGLRAVQAASNAPDQPGETQRLADVDQIIDAILSGSWAG